MSLLDNAFNDPAFAWSPRYARHLLNRAGFGVPPSAIERLTKMKPAGAVDAFVNYEKFPDEFEKPNWLPEYPDYQALRMIATNLSEDEKRKIRQQKMRGERESLMKLQMWWLDRMCHSQRPLEEKMTLFWHGHFAVSAQKVQSARSNYTMNDLLRQNATGNFKNLVTKVGKSAAMLQYLDNQQNIKGKPNENWARELMELFTLGIGNYTEKDIKESARSFTGWSARKGEFIFTPRRHDEGQKTFLGQTGNFDGDDIIAIILQQPACAEFICGKLWKFFAYENPEPEVVKGLAETFRKSNYQLKPVLSQLFSSRGFYSDKAVWTQIKSPSQVVANLLVQLDAPVSERPPVAQLAMRAMGQELFYPPNVKGWDGGRDWINTNTLLVRCNFASYLVSGVVPEFNGRGAGARVLKKVAEREDRMQMHDDDSMMQSAMNDEAANNGDKMQEDDDAAQRLRDAPAGQDAMASDIPSRTLAKAIQQHKAGVLETRQMARAPFEARTFFSRFEGMSADEIVDEMSQFFLGYTLDGSKRQQLISALAQGVSPGAPVPVMKMAEEDLRATVQLLLSTAEYQLC
jgi:uncharacterized protein (DUF1800 family)